MDDEFIYYICYVIHMDQSPDKDHSFISFVLTKCSKPTRPNQPIVYRACAEDKLLFSVKCIYAYVAQRSEIIAENFTKFFITFAKPHHPASRFASSMSERSNGRFWYNRYRNLEAS